MQIWVPDIRSSTYRAEAHRQSLLVASGDSDDQTFIDALSEGAIETR